MSAPYGATSGFCGFDFLFGIVKGEQPLTPGCGSQRMLRPLGGPCSLLAAAPAGSSLFPPLAAVVAAALRGEWSPEDERGSRNTPLVLWLAEQVATLRK